MRQALFFLSLCLVCGCSEDPSPTGEIANVTDFEISNITARDLQVRVEPGGGEVSVGAGETVLIETVGSGYVSFVTPAKTFNCISVVDTESSVLVYQQHPVSDSSWSSMRLAVRVMLYQLVLSEVDLTDSGVSDECAP